jgi:hypothetical protein
MKLSFLKIRTNSQLKKNKAVRSSLPYTQAKTVGVLFSVEDKKKHDEIKALIHKLEHDGKKVDVISFLPNKKENYEFMFDFFTMKEVTFFGQITSNHAIKFSETPFDYLFCLDAEPNPMILNLLARSKAKCRVGKFQEEATPFFELMIDNVDKQTKGLIDGIYKYTAQLK